MRKIHGILLGLLCCILLISCASPVPQNEKEAMTKETVSEVQYEWYKLGDYERAVALLDRHLKDASPEKTGVTKNDEIQIVKLERLNENYYLASYQIYPVYPLTNMNYALIGFQEKSCRTINLDTGDYISDVTYDNGVLSFYCEGNNVFNGFREFPHNINYDIAKGEISREQLYYSLKHGSQVRLGNCINKIGIKSIAENNKQIAFAFGEVEGTMLAGGGFCPSIKSGVMFDKEDKQVFYLDFENLFLSKENEKMIMDLSKKEYISSIDIKTYEGFAGEHHTVIYLRFDGLSEYTCSFKYDEKTDFNNLILTLR